MSVHLETVNIPESIPNLVPETSNNGLDNDIDLDPIPNIPPMNLDQESFAQETTWRQQAIRNRAAIDTPPQGPTLKSDTTLNTFLPQASIMKPIPQESYD